MAIGKTAPNGTLNADGAFYSVQDVNVLLENAGGGGGELPTPTVADAGSVVVVDEEGKYALGEAGGGGDAFLITLSESNDGYVADKTEAEIIEALKENKVPVICFTISNETFINNNCRYEIYTENSTDYLDSFTAESSFFVPVLDDQQHIMLRSYIVTYLSDESWGIYANRYEIAVTGGE